MYDVAVLGAGPGGYVAALRAALRGAKVCCIEQKNLGGTCLNVGCIPTKAMLHASELYWEMNHAASGYGFGVSGTTVDGTAFMKRTQSVPANLRKGVEFLLKKRKVDIIKGKGHLVDANSIKITTKDNAETTIQARNIILATGSRPARPGFLDWSSDRLITTDEATTATTLPKSILILGGGVIGCEFATVYAELGIEVIMVEMLDSLVANMDKDIIKAVTSGLKKRKVKIYTSSKVVSVKPSAKSAVTELEDGKTFETEYVLVAVGRQAVTENLGLEQLGVTIENYLIKVDNHCRTNIPNIYAIGDIAETRQYAHLASRMGIVAADNATGHETTDKRDIVPSGIYTRPEVASVGLTEQQARQLASKKGNNIDIRIAVFPYSASGMAQAYGQTTGQVKIIADKKLGEILGAVVIGPHATDVIQEITLAMRSELTVEDIAHTIHPHPTFGEAVGEAAEMWLGLPLHTI